MTVIFLPSSDKRSATIMAALLNATFMSPHSSNDMPSNYLKEVS